jgi:pilus assembly protein CpaE
MSDMSFAVLLPRATVALFVTDAEAQAHATALMTDWRFARVTFEIHDGNVDSAITHYAQNPSPELVLVQTDSIDESFPQKLEVLADHCSEHTSAVVLGPVNDVYLYRKLIDMGVTDYLVRPVAKDVLADVIAKALLSKIGASDSHLIAVVGSKGGVGTSTLAQSLAHIISGRLHHKTVMVDACGGASYLTVAMGLEPITTLSEAARAAQSSDQDAFKRLLSSVNDRLTILASGADGFLDDAISVDQFESILNRIVPVSPVIIVDLSGASAGIRRQTLARANDVVVVTTPSLPALRAARLLVQETKTIRGGSDKDIAVVLNRVGEAAGLEISKIDAESALEQKLSLTLPFDAKFYATLETSGKSLLDIKGGESLISTLMPLVHKSLRSGDSAQPADKAADENLLARLFGRIHGG